jgi:hypothetical protein
MIGREEDEYSPLDRRQKLDAVACAACVKPAFP